MFSHLPAGEKFLLSWYYVTVSYPAHTIAWYEDAHFYTSNFWAVLKYSEKAFALNYAAQIIRSIADVLRTHPQPNQEGQNVILEQNSITVTFRLFKIIQILYINRNCDITGSYTILHNSPLSMNLNFA